MVIQVQHIARRRKQRERLRQWHNNVMNEMETGEIEARSHVERTRLDKNRPPTESIRSWMLGALKMKRKLKECTQNDIRFFQ